MTKCAFCEREELLPFTCRYCGQSFCAEHRLPENHDCSAIGMRVIPMRRSSDGSFKSSRIQRSPFRTSRTEILHLIAGVFIFFVVYTLDTFQLGAPVLLSLLGMVLLAFVLHELAHKFTAQHYGLWSEFRLDPLGTIISLFTAFLPFKIVAPGAVLIFGSGANEENMGKIALSGPLTNMLQTVVFIFLAQFFPLSLFTATLFWYAAALNASLAFFNLIPVSIFDGRKVFAWSKKAWAVAFAAALILWIIFV